MTDITKISVELTTSADSSADVSGWVYLSIAGREFSIDANRNDFEPGDSYTYIFGDGSNVLFAEGNDPRNPQLDTDDLDRFPVSLRYAAPEGEQGESWKLERVTVTVNPDGDFPARFDNLRLEGAPSIRLGQRYGHKVYLRRV